VLSKKRERPGESLHRAAVPKTSSACSAHSVFLASHREPTRPPTAPRVALKVRRGFHGSTTPFTYPARPLSPAKAVGTSSSDEYRCVTSGRTSIVPPSSRRNALT